MYMDSPNSFIWRNDINSDEERTLKAKWKYAEFTSLSWYDFMSTKL